MLKGVLSRSLEDTLVAVAGYRNRLVHRYNLVTEDELHHILTDHACDIRELTRQIRDLVARVWPEETHRHWSLVAEQPVQEVLTSLGVFRFAFVHR